MYTHTHTVTGCNLPEAYGWPSVPLHLSHTQTAHTQFTLSCRDGESETHFLRPADRRVRNHTVTEMLEKVHLVYCGEDITPKSQPVGVLHTLYHILSYSSTWLLFKAGAILPQWDEGHGSTSEGEEDRLEECVPPYIPALTFIVVWHCSYHRPTMLYSGLLLRGGIMGSSNLHAPPRFHGKRKWSISYSAWRLTDRRSQAFTVGTVWGVCLWRLIW